MYRKKFLKINLNIYKSCKYNIQNMLISKLIRFIKKFKINFNKKL